MEELMKEEKEGVKAAEQEKPKKRRNRKKNRKNEMRKSYFAGMISMLAIVMIVLVGTTFLWPGSSADHPGGAEARGLGFGVAGIEIVFEAEAGTRRRWQRGRGGRLRRERGVSASVS